MTEKEIKKYVDSVFNETEMYSTPVEIITIANYYGFAVYELPMDDNTSGMIISGEKKVKNFNTNKVIIVNQNHLPSRKRFTIAHELGHYILANKPTDCYAHRDFGVYNKEEKDANSFASALLMPEKDIMNEVKEFENSKRILITSHLISHIARKFNVSISAAEIRLKKLDII